MEEWREERSGGRSLRLLELKLRSSMALSFEKEIEQWARESDKSSDCRMERRHQTEKWANIRKQARPSIAIVVRM